MESKFVQALLLTGDLFTFSAAFIFSLFTAEGSDCGAPDRAGGAEDADQRQGDDGWKQSAAVRRENGFSLVT